MRDIGCCQITILLQNAVTKIGWNGRSTAAKACGLQWISSLSCIVRIGGNGWALAAKTIVRIGGKERAFATKAR